MAARKPLRRSPAPGPVPAFEREHIERIGRSAQRWEWRARGGDPRAKAASQVLNALAWALRNNDVDALKRMARHAATYLEELGPWSLPFAQDASAAYEAITVSIERHALAGVEGEPAKRRAAALWFVVKARQLGFELPGAPRDDEAAIALCVEALEQWKTKVFDDDQARAESWVRAMAIACGRRDGPNATKRRMKKGRPAK